MFAPSIFNVVLSALKTFLPKKYGKLVNKNKNYFLKYLIVFK